MHAQRRAARHRLDSSSRGRSPVTGGGRTRYSSRSQRCREENRTPSPTARHQPGFPRSTAQFPVTAYCKAITGAGEPLYGGSCKTSALVHGWNRRAGPRLVADDVKISAEPRRPDQRIGVRPARGMVCTWCLAGIQQISAFFPEVLSEIPTIRNAEL